MDSDGSADSARKRRGIAAFLSRRSVLKKIGVLGGITGLGGASYIALFTRQAAAQLGDLTVADTTIETADGEVATVELEIITFLIDHVNLTNEDDVTATLEITAASDHIGTDEEIDSQADITIPDNGPNGDLNVVELESTYDLLTETSLTAEDFENNSDGTIETHDLTFRGTVTFSDHEDLTEDFEETAVATVSVENVAADADAQIDGETGGDPETEPGDLE